MIRIRFGKLFLSQLSTKAVGIKISRRRMHLLQDKAFVNGAWVSAQEQQTFNVINPANEKVIGAVPDMATGDVQKAIDAAHEAFYEKSWANSTAKQRADLLKVKIEIQKFLLMRRYKNR